MALGGGGARGFAHAGALKALEECGLRPDILAGVSAGSVAAVFYAAGLTPEQIVDVFSGHTFRDFCEWHVPHTGVLSLNGFEKFVAGVVGYRNIEDLPIPVVIGATDFDRGETVTFDHGPVAERVVASCSIPIVFEPKVIDGVRYVDGGVLHNLPAAAIRNRCRYLLGVNVSPLRHRTVNHTLIDTAMRSYELVTKTNTRQDKVLCDLCVEMNDIADYQVFNLKEVRKVFQVGYMTMMEHLRANGIKPQ